MSDPIFLIVQGDYARIARLAISLTFGMLLQRLGHDVWTMEKQLAVTDLVAGCVERGGTLPAGFLYLPLHLGELMVVYEVQMPGENPAQSLDLLDRARQRRNTNLTENPDLARLLEWRLKAARTGPQPPAAGSRTKRVQSSAGFARLPAAAFRVFTDRFSPVCEAAPDFGTQ